MTCPDCNTDGEHRYISYKGNLFGDELLDCAKKLIKIVIFLMIFLSKMVIK